MVDRAQPGAIDSLIRNDELRQIFGRFSDGFIVPASDPTPAAQRRGDINETVLNSFTLTTASGSSLDVTVAPGEGFVGGWFCRDVATTVTLPANATVDIVVGFDDRAIFDPNVDADRDEADAVIVDVAQNVDDTLPTTVAHRVTTDGSGVTSTERIASVGPALTEQAVGFRHIRAFDLVDARFTGVTADISSNSPAPEGIAFGPDGRRLFTTDDTNGEVVRFDLAGPFDISGVSFISILDISTQTTFPTGITFNGDGSRMFVTDNSDRLLQFELSSPFEITTATFTTALDTSGTSGGDLIGIDFGSRGRRVITNDNINQRLIQFNLSSPFDFTSGTFTAQFDYSPQTTLAGGIVFGDDGERLFITDQSNNRVLQFALGDRFDIATATFDTGFDISSETTAPENIRFSNAGSQLFVVETDGTPEVIEYEVGRTVGF